MSFLSRSLGLAILLLAPSLASSAKPTADMNAAWMLQTNALEGTSFYSLGKPNVLVLGDSISIGYTPFLRKRLSEVANVNHPQCNCCSTRHYLRKDGGMRDWVGTNRWDVITVNCGIWDFCYMKGDPFFTDHYWGPSDEERELTPLRRGTSARARGFHLRTPIPEYTENLRKILVYLKSTGATVLFALTTPCPAFEQDDRCGLARAYNEEAATVCRKLGVRTVDLYAVGEKNYDNQGDGTHYNETGNDALAAALEKDIRHALAEVGRNTRIDIRAKIISDGHRVVSKDEWYGYDRTVFEFLGCETWAIEPKVETKGRPWAWIMEWPGAFAKRTGSIALLEAGYHVVTFRPGFYKDGKFESRPGNMNDKRLVEARAFQEYLVKSLGFASKANLIGMSWGGFYSVRYAGTYPEEVAHIYLDAPLLDFSTLKGKSDAYWDISGKYGVDIGTYIGRDDPRQPVNMFGPIAKAKIPVLLLYGGSDQTVNPDLNCRRFAKSLQDAGGVIEVAERGPFGHWPHGLEVDEQEKFVKFFNGVEK